MVPPVFQIRLRNCSSTLTHKLAMPTHERLMTIEPLKDEPLRVPWRYFVFNEPFQRSYRRAAYLGDVIRNRRPSSLSGRP